MNKISIYIVGYYSATRKKDMLPLVTIWMDLEHIMLSKQEKPDRERQALYDVRMWNLKQKSSNM